jgi:tungstate transport system ATP-binding protein
MASISPIYEIQKLRHHYNGRTVLDIPELSISRSTIVGLMGPNGSGKSTLLRLLGFIDEPAAGNIFYEGKLEKPFSDAVRSHVSLLPQNPYLMKRTVFKNIAYGLQLKNQLEGIKDRVFQAMNMVGLDAERFGKRQWHELSGGEAQRVALAARLALRPRTLLMDEPTASVDAASVQLIKEAALQSRQEWGTTLIIASHDLGWLHEVCDQVFHLFRGRIFGSGHETILFGPWSRREDGLWEKNIGGGPGILVSKPPYEEAAAVIASDAIFLSLSGQNIHDGLAELEGVVSRLTLEKFSGRIITSIRVGSLFVTALLNKDEPHKFGIYPGRSVRVYYDPLAVQWI